MLQETAGVSTSMNGKYFTDVIKLEQSFTLPWDLHDSYAVDFFDEDDRIMNYVGHLFEGDDPVIPRDRLIAIRFDVAYASDLAGVGVGYLKEMKCINADLGLYEPVIDIPVAFGVSRKPGQETPITKLKNFVYDLSALYDIGVITTDSFQSKNMQQDLVRDGFRSYYISMDRNNQAYDLAKAMIYEGRLHFAANKLLMRDMINLRIIGGKVDHLPIYCLPGDTKIKIVDHNGNNLEINIENLINNYDYKVISYDIENNTFEEDYIDDAFISGYTDELIEIELEDNSKFRCTYDHLILTDRGYIKAKDLNENDNIINLLSN